MFWLFFMAIGVYRWNIHFADLPHKLRDYAVIDRT